MQVLTPHLDRQGRISYRYDNTQEYLCGMRFTNDKGWIDYIAYWGENPAQAVNVWDLCKVWGPIADNYKASPNLDMETLVGCTSSKETCRPWRMYVGGRQTVYLSSQGLSLEQGTYEEATPEWLSAATKPTAPRLVPQSLYDYAFKVGTLCSMGTEPPNWEPLIPVLAARADAFIPTSEVGMEGVVSVMGEYYQAGTLCKSGTQLSDIPIIKTALLWETSPYTANDNLNL